MATFDNAAVDAQEVQEAIRGLAHASRAIADVEDTYAILGSLSSSLSSLQQCLDQLANCHERNAGRATDDDGNRATGRQHASAAAEGLRDAAVRVRQAQGAVDEAWNHNGRIAWQPDVVAEAADRDAGRSGSRRRAPASAFGADTTCQHHDPLGR